MKRILMFSLITLFSSHISIAICKEYPQTIVIKDYSADAYIGRYEYEYELVLTGDYYELFQCHLLESDRKGERIRSKRRSLKNIPIFLVDSLINEIENPRDSLGLSDLGFSYNWFSENKEELYNIAERQWQERWPEDRAWNSHQISFIKEELVKGENISRAVQQKFIGTGIIVLHSTRRSKLTIELKYDQRTTILSASRNYLGLPWVINDGQTLYNQGISKIINELIPGNKGFNKKRLEPKEQEYILAGIVRKLYDNYCEREVKKLAHHNYKEEINELRAQFEISGLKEERSGTNNWDGEDRLFMYAKSVTENRNICLGINLTYEGETLYTRDSVLKKAEYYQQLVNEIPFLLEYLDEDPERRIEIAFDNGFSLSEKVKKYQAGHNSWYEGACLIGASEEFLNNSVAFILRNESGEGSNWLITPDLDVILVYYQHSTVYRYNDEDLGLEGPSIRYACKHFDLNGNIKE